MLKKTKHEKKKARKNQRKNQGFKHWFFLIGFLAYFLPDQASGQGIDLPFKNGEVARYGAYYNLDFIWLQNGEVVFRADTVRYKKQKAWHLEATGKTFKAFDLILSVRDTFETFSDFETFRPIYAHRNMYHGKESSIHQYWFDYRSGKINTHIFHDNKLVYHGNLPVRENTFDLLATAYDFRKYNFDKLFVGEKVPYRMIIDRQVADLYFRYQGKEIVKTCNGEKYRCHKVSVYLLRGDFFPEGEDMTVWFTDDRNHLPIQVETKVLLGSVKALLLDAKDLKYPLISKIE